MDWLSVILQRAACKWKLLVGIALANAEINLFHTILKGEKHS